MRPDTLPFLCRIYVSGLFSQLTRVKYPGAKMI
jgi:hypothetical protein